MDVRLLYHTPDPERAVAVAARLCYAPVGAAQLMDDLPDESVLKVLRTIMTSGHFSALEHATYTFAVDGVSLTVDAGPHTDRFTVNLVPHTLRWTDFARARPGRAVNLEMDVLVKAARTGDLTGALSAADPGAAVHHADAAAGRTAALSRDFILARGFGRKGTR